MKRLENDSGDDEDEGVAVGVVDGDFFAGFGGGNVEGLEARGGLLEIVDGEDHVECGVRGVGDEGDGLGRDAGKLEPESGVRF